MADANLTFTWPTRPRELENRLFGSLGLFGQVKVKFVSTPSEVDHGSESEVRVNS